MKRKLASTPEVRVRLQVSSNPLVSRSAIIVGVFLLALITSLVTFISILLGPASAIGIVIITGAVIATTLASARDIKAMDELSVEVTSSGPTFFMRFAPDSYWAIREGDGEARWRRFPREEVEHRLAHLGPLAAAVATDELEHLVRTGSEPSRHGGLRLRRRATVAQ